MTSNRIKFYDSAVSYLFIIGLISMFSCLITIYVLSIENWSFYDAGLLSAYFLSVFGVLFYITKTKKAPSAK